MSQINQKTAAELMEEFCKIDLRERENITKFYPETMKAIDVITSSEPKVFVKILYIEIPAQEDEDDVHSRERHRAEVSNAFVDKQREAILNVPEIQWNVEDSIARVLNARDIRYTINRALFEAREDLSIYLGDDYASIVPVLSGESGKPQPFIAVTIAIPEEFEEKADELQINDAIAAKKLYNDAAKFRNNIRDFELNELSFTKSMMEAGRLYMPNDSFPVSIIDKPNITTRMLNDKLEKMYHTFDIILLVSKAGFEYDVISEVYKRKRNNKSAWLGYADKSDYISAQNAIIDGEAACCLECVAEYYDDECDRALVLVLNADADNLIDVMNSIISIDDLLIDRLNHSNRPIYMSPERVFSSITDGFDIVTPEFIEKARDACDELMCDDE